MPFDRSQIQVLGRNGTLRPRRELTAAVYGNGPMAAPTVAPTYQTLSGVVIRISPAIFNALRAKLNAAEKTQLDGWFYELDINHADPLLRPQTWGIAVWAGETKVLCLRIPAGTWNDPNGNPPANVKRFLAHLFWE